MQMRDHSTISVLERGAHARLTKHVIWLIVGKIANNKVGHVYSYWSSLSIFQYWDLLWVFLHGDYLLFLKVGFKFLSTEEEFLA